MITLLVSDKIPIEKGNYECILGKFLLTASKKSTDIPNFTVIINSHNMRGKVLSIALKVLSCNPARKVRTK